jgi:AcrR family transcriptional regulator
MSRTGGEKTKSKILAIAEKLFAEKGYDGTSIQDIARTAKVNKALIYYHFKNKQDIIDSLFKQTLDEMFGMEQRSMHDKAVFPSDKSVEEKVGYIIEFLSKKKKILTVMLMESLKDDSSGHFSLFKCADLVIKENVSEMMHKLEKHHGKKADRDELLIHEFFTGFLPVVFFAIFKDKWASYFNCDKKKMTGLFSKVFRESHIRHM